MERLVWAVSILWLSFDPIVAAAQCADAACVRTGSSLTIDDRRSQLLDLMLSSLTGTHVDLTVEEHRALSSAELSLDDLASALATRGIADSLELALSAEASLPAMLQSIALALHEVGQSAASDAASKLGTQLENATGTLKLGIVLQVDGRPLTWSPTRFGALDLVTALIQRYNIEHVAAAHSVEAAAATLGLAAPFEALALTFVAVDAPVFTCGPTGSQLRSAALRVRAHATLAGSPVELSVSGVDLASVALSELDLVVSIGRMRSTLQAIDAIAPAVTLQIAPGVAALYAGTISDALLLDRGTPIDPDTGLGDGAVGVLSVQTGAMTSAASVRLKSYAATSAATPSSLQYGGPFPETQTLASGETSVADGLASLLSSASVRIGAFEGGFTLPDATLAALEAEVATPVGQLLASFAAGSLDSALELAGQGTSAASVTVVRGYSAPPAITCDDGNACTANDHCDSGGCRGTPQIGAWCDDRAFCTQGEACDANGACSGGYARDCSDGLDCTVDTCDEVEFCVSTLTSGCLIDGRCYAIGEVDPGDECHTCQQDSPFDWISLPAGTTCDDGQFCTDGDQCTVAGTCLGAPRVCADLFSCATEACNEATDACEPNVTTGCAIDGACRVDGSLDPTNPCHYCDSAHSRTEWSNVPQFTRCDDEKTCVVDEMCDGAGACRGVPRNCDDGQPCTIDACDESAHGCVSTQALPGSSCDDGKFCTVGETCDAEGQCAGQSRPCADALSCTSDLCNEATDRCEYVALLSCVLNGQCVIDGQANPTDNCQFCNAAQSTTAWSPRLTLECLAMNPQGDPDEDGLASAQECPLGLAMCPDSDDDGQPDYLDPDDDEDGILTRFEHTEGAVLDHDHDGLPDARDPDDDGDGVLTRTEASEAASERDPSDARDTDADGVPDYLDPDDDGDGLPTLQEFETAKKLGEDRDADGLPDYRDLDSDGDGRPDGFEGAIDSDGDGVPDYLQPYRMPAEAGAGGAAAGSGGANAGAGEAPESDAGAHDNDASDDTETRSNAATDPGRAADRVTGGACNSVVFEGPARGAAWWCLMALAGLRVRRRRRGGPESIAGER